jgi:hypothetical protein
MLSNNFRNNIPNKIRPEQECEKPVQHTRISNADHQEIAIIARGKMQDFVQTQVEEAVDKSRNGNSL